MTLRPRCLRWTTTSPFRQPPKPPQHSHAWGPENDDRFSLSDNQPGLAARSQVITLRVRVGDCSGGDGNPEVFAFLMWHGEFVGGPLGTHLIQHPPGAPPRRGVWYQTPCQKSMHQLD
jgi:hypothetical protein